MSKKVPRSVSEKKACVFLENETSKVKKRDLRIVKYQIIA